MDRYDAFDIADELLPRKWKTRLVQATVLGASVLAWLGHPGVMNAMGHSAVAVAEHRTHAITDWLLDAIRAAATPTPRPDRTPAPASVPGNATP